MNESISHPGSCSDSAVPNLGENGRCLYFVRLGLHGQIGRLRSEGDIQYVREQRVVCRTARGIELGTVLSTTEQVDESMVRQGEDDGVVVRLAAPEDNYLNDELVKLAEGFVPEATQAFLSIDPTALLLEIEPMLDCQTVYFHFLGDVSDAVQMRAGEMANRFQAIVGESRFAEMLQKGCGPGCGTTDKGCGSKGGKGCAGCAVSRACSTKAH